MAITKVINDAVDLNQTTDYSGLRLPVGTTGNVVESFTTDYLVVGGGGSGSLQGAGGAGGLRTSYNNSTTTTNTLSFPSGKTAIATYMLDNNATDVSGNYNGTETNITYNTGQYGGAASFDGTDNILLPTGSPFNDSNTIKAISAWGKRSGSGRISLFSISDTGFNFISVSILATGLYFTARRGSSSNQLSANSLQSIDNNWHHVAIVYDASGIKWYLDGQEQSVTYTTTGTATNSSWISYPAYSGTPKAYIGRSRQNSPSYSDGLIDQVRIYDTALSSTDVTNIYNNEVQANSGGGTAAESSLTLTAGTAYDVTVGTGGIDTSTSGGSSGSGSNSIFSTITSIGGGGAGTTSSSSTNANGKNGGSGGGAGSNTAGSPGSGTLGQGYIGGTALFFGGSYAGGGGGGAASSGGNTTSNTVAGNGGAQLNLAITGNSVGYAGGGGGSLYGTGTVGTNDSSAGAAAPSGSSSANGESAPFNLGGGGGGANHITGTTNITGGAGGSGVVILRYPTASISSFTTTGTLNTPSTTDTIADTAYPVANTAYYKLDNSAIDLSGSTGKFDQGGVFNGSSSYIQADGIFSSSPSVMSASVWFKTTVDGNILDIGDSSVSTAQNRIFFSSGLLYVSLNGGGGGFASTSATGLQDGNWHHIVAVWDDGTVTNGIKMYIDGATTPTAQGNSTQSFISALNLFIGANDNRGSSGSPSIRQYFNGSIDQVRLYNVALSSTDVTALYNETVSTTGQLNFPSGQTAIATYELNGNANGILTTTDLSTVNYPAGAGCIALYEMNGTADDTSGVYNGTPSNINYNFGAFGQAAVFNGSSSYIDISSLTYLFDSKATATVSLWFNTSTTATTSVLFSDYASSTARNFLVSINSTGNIVWNTRYGSGAGRDSNITTTSTYNDGIWHHIVLSIDQAANAKSMYVDGSQIGSSIALPTATGASFDSTQRVTMGSSYNTGTAAYQDYYNGKIDQVRIFNTALTQAQVTTLARGIGTSYSGADTNVLYAYNGTPTNVTYGNGRFNEAAVFNGSSSYVNTGFKISSGAFTFSCWAKLDSTSSRICLGNAGTTTTSSAGGVGFEVQGASSSKTLDLTGGNTDYQSEFGISNYNGAFQGGKIIFNASSSFQHYVGTYDGTDLKLYIDGTLVGTQASPDQTANANNFYLGRNGRSYASSYRYMEGSLDQVRIYDAALTSSQVTEVYNEHYQTKFTDGSDTAIVFTEGTGTVTFSGVDPAPPQGALRANTSYSEDGSGSVIEHYNGTAWKYFDAIKYCTTNTLNFPSGAGCIASYNFNNNVNDIGNTYNGVNSNVTFNASGKFGAAAVFNGSSSYITADKSMFGTGDGVANLWSISLWFKTDGSVTASRTLIATKGSGSQAGFFLYMISGGQIRYYEGNTSTNSQQLTTTATYDDSNWHNIVITRSGTTDVLTMYIDGTEVISPTTMTNPHTSHNFNLHIGRYPASATFFWDGSIDQVRIFNDSLTSDEVSKLYNNEIACS